MRSVLNWLRTSVKSGFAFAAATFLAGIGAVEGGVTTLAKWEMTVAIPSSTTGTTYSPPGTPSNQAGTPSSGLLTGSASAILSAYHAVSATTYTSPAGNGSQYSFASNNWSPNDYYQIYLPTTGYSGISVSWDQARSGTGPAAFKLQMSTNGTSFTDLLSYTVLQSGGTGAPGTWNTSIYDSSYTNTFSLPGTGGNQGALYLRFTNAETSTSSSGGTNRIDDIIVIASGTSGGSGGAVPEPTSMAIFGLGALGFAYRNRRKLVK
jgi:hypothetical protein